MKRQTKKGPRRRRAMPVSSKRFVVTDCNECPYITAGKAYKVSYIGSDGEEIVDDDGCVIEIVTPRWSLRCGHLLGRHWSWVTL